MEFGLQPEWQCRHPRAQALRRERDVRFDQTVELSQRFVVEPHIIEVRRSDTALAQAILNSVDWETMVMFDARESLFLCRRHNLAVDNKRCRGVVVERRNAEDAR